MVVSYCLWDWTSLYMRMAATDLLLAADSVSPTSPGNRRLTGFCLFRRREFDLSPLSARTEIDKPFVAAPLLYQYLFLATSPVKLQTEYPVSSGTSKQVVALSWDSPTSPRDYLLHPLSSGSKGNKGKVSVLSTQAPPMPRRCPTCQACPFLPLLVHGRAYRVRRGKYKKGKWLVSLSQKSSSCLVGGFVSVEEMDPLANPPT